MERVQFQTMGTMEQPGTTVDFQVGVNASHFTNSPRGSVTGSMFNDTIDVGAEYPGIKLLETGINVNMAGGNDTVIGGLGRDTVLATLGDDVIHGGGSTDLLRAPLENVTSGLLDYKVVDGVAQVTLDGVTIITVTETAPGAYLVRGVTGTVGERIGTETLTSIETFQVTRPGGGAGSYITIPLREELHNVADNGGRYTGGFGDDLIDIPALYPLIVADDSVLVPGVAIQSGWGDDTITGSAGRDAISATQGNDVVDGGASLYDYMVFNLRTGDTGQITTNIAENGQILIKRDAETIFTITENQDGSFTVAGVAGTEGEFYGTDTIRNIEVLYFNRQPATTASTGSFLTLGLAERAFTTPYGQAVYDGSFKADVLDLGAAFPGIVASTDGTPVKGVFSEPDHGDDVVTGSAGDDIVIAGAGTDSFTGGAGWDRLVFDFTELPEILPLAAFTKVVADNGDTLVQVMGETILTFHRQGDGSVLITGVGMAEAFGTELIGADVEEVALDYLGDGTYTTFSLNMGPEF